MNLHHTNIKLPIAMNITICGGGNGAHATAAYLGSKTGLSINVLTRKPSEWSNILKLITEDSSWEKKGEINGIINKVSDDPAKVIPESDIILIAAPAHVHSTICQKIAPYLKKGAILGSIYCQGGFDWAVMSAIKDINNIDGFFGLQNIPWLCRTIEYGKIVKLIGPKKHLVLASYPIERALSYSHIISLLFDIPTKIVPNFLCLTLSPSNQIIHPARYYGIFHNWDGINPIPENQVQWGLYTEMDDLSTNWLSKLDKELQDIKNGIVKNHPDINLDSVMPIGERIINQYGDDVLDRSNLKMIFRTNKGYAGVKTPSEKVKDGFIKPAINSRLFWEDIPFGLCILKSISQMLNLQTPSIDFMIIWHQKFMGKEYLIDNKLNPAIFKETGAPEAYGIFDLKNLVASSRS